jgi:hypothetical protein
VDDDPTEVEPSPFALQLESPTPELLAPEPSTAVTRTRRGRQATIWLAFLAVTAVCFVAVVLLIAINRSPTGSVDELPEVPQSGALPAPEAALEAPERPEVVVPEQPQPQGNEPVDSTNDDQLVDAIVDPAATQPPEVEVVQTPRPSPTVDHRALKRQPAAPREAPREAPQKAPAEPGEEQLSPEERQQQVNAILAAEEQVIAQSRACVARGDPQCCIDALSGGPRTPRVYNILRSCRQALERRQSLSAPDDGPE